MTTPFDPVPMVPGAMGMSAPTADPWIPHWARILLVIVLAVVAAVHVRHQLDGSTRARVWHGGHVLMAAGMIDMFWPAGPMPVGGRAGCVVFAIAAVLAVIGTGADTARRRRWCWPGVLAATDFAAMAYMFAAPSAPWWAAWALAGWFLAQSIGWGSGRLPLVDGPGPGHSGRHEIAVRATLTVMAVAMAYMFVAMTAMPAMVHPGHMRARGAGAAAITP